MNEVAAASSKGTVFEDVLEVLWAPGQVFDRSRAKGVGMYILVLTAITLVIVLATTFCGITDEHRLGEAFTSALPFTALLVVFFAIVAVIHDQHLIQPLLQ